MNGLTPNWKKSTRSNGADSCVEARHVANLVEVRDTKDREGPSLAFSPQAWIAFLAETQAGTFDLS